MPIAALVWWVAGFLPWIVDGLGADRPDASWASAPLTSDRLGDLVLYAGVGGVLAGLTVLLGRDGRARRAAFVLSGVGLAAVVVLAQSRSAFGGSDARLLDGLTLIGCVAALLGTGVGLLAMAGGPGVGIALAVLAGSASIWVLRWLDASGLGGQQAEIGDWIRAAVLAGALVVIGIRPVSRAVWWPLSVFAAWSIMPIVVATSYFGAMLRSGVDAPGVLGESFSASLDVWRMAASPDMRPLTSWIVAVVAAIGIVAAREMRERAAA